jgi:hypothetical protein
MGRPSAALGVALAGLILTGAPSQKAPHALEGRAPAAPVSCIDAERVDSVEIVGARTIIYRDAGRVWVTGPDDACPALRPDVLLVVEQSGSQYCRGDRFAVVERGSRVPSSHCHFTAFTPWVPAAAAAAH